MVSNLSSASYYNCLAWESFGNLSAHQQFTSAAGMISSEQMPSEMHGSKQAFSKKWLTYLFSTNLPHSNRQTMNPGLVIRIHVRNMTYPLPPRSEDGPRPSGGPASFRLRGCLVPEHHCRLHPNKHIKILSREEKKWLYTFSKYWLLKTGNHFFRLLFN